MNDLDLAKFTKLRKTTKNIVSAECKYSNGTVAFNTASSLIRSITQNLIDLVDDHKHLRGLRILVLRKDADADGRKLAKGKRISIGKAFKMSPKDRMLASITGEGDTPTFAILLSGYMLDRFSRLDEAEFNRKVVALIDHELMHCGAKVTGEFVEESEVSSYVEDLGTRHIETTHNVRDDNDCVLVRFYATDVDGNYIPICRKHDIEEFTSVARRHGPWLPDLARLVDELVASEPNLFGREVA